MGLNLLQFVVISFTIFAMARPSEFEDKKTAAKGIEKPLSKETDEKSFPYLNPNPVIETGLDGGVTYMNPAARRAFPDLEAYSAKHPMLEGLSAEAEKCPDNGQSNLVRQVQDGVKIYEEHISIIPHLRRIRIYAMDITERAGMENALRVHQERLEEIVEARTVDLEILNEQFRKEIDERTNTENKLHQRVEMERILNDIATRFIRFRSSALDGSIDYALRLLGEYSGADRSFVFLLCKDGVTASNTHEWCAEGIPPNIRHMQNVPLETFSFFFDSFKNLQTFHVPDSSALPAGAAPEKDEMAAHDVKSMVCVPLGYRKKMLGFMGFLTIRQARGWAEEDLRMFEIVVGIFSSALMRKQDREKLRESYQKVAALKRKAEAANRLKSQFLANMSHDIRTPLNGILGFTDLLFKNNPDSTSSEYLEKIKVSGEALLNLIDDILDFSKIEAGQLDIHHRTFKVNEMIENLRAIFEHRLAAQGVEFQVKRTGRVPAMICNDKWRINQVLINLLSNALKFTDSGYVCLAVRYKRNTDRLEFRVKDSGIGINPGDKEKIFDPFSQAHLSFKPGKKGSGLGLAICKNLADLMGGSIGVRPAQGKGTEFIFEIPANSDRVREEDAEPKVELNLDSAIEEKKGNTILVAEDNPVNRELILEQFKKAGFHSILIAENGREAVDMALEHLPDLVLMDIHMPVMDGNEAIAELKRGDFPNPIVGLSAYAMREDVEKSLNTGAAGYITKPIDFDRFFSKIGLFLKPKPVQAAPDQESRAEKEVEPGPAEDYRISVPVSERIRGLFLKDIKEKTVELEKIAAGGGKPPPGTWTKRSTSIPRPGNCLPLLSPWRSV
jgi:signal transduction histidine kinase/CheY-like chemotaxis protein